MSILPHQICPQDIVYLERAVALALEAEKAGNLPVGALITLNDLIIAEGASAIVVPDYHPGRHAETEALRMVRVELWAHASQMTCYTTLEPCMMCMGTLLLHGVGRVVFGARDPLGGAGTVLPHLPAYYANVALVPAWIGPLLPDVCDALYERVTKGFDTLPCGREREG